SSTVPTGTENMFDNTNDCQITVPFYAIDTYKSNWSVYADRISPDQEVLDFTFNGNQVTGYNGSATEIEIPASYSIKNVDGIDKFIVGNDYLVTSIGEAAFSNSDRITSITIPENITNIGISAFFNCLKLTTINFNAVTLDNLGQNSNIFYNAGKNGTGITVNIGNSVKSIPNYLFYIQELSGRPKIKTVNFGENLQSIGNNAFQFCSNINSLTIPNSVISIGDSAFQYCTGLTSVVLPSNIVQIGSSVFRDCRALTSIIIPNAVERISEYAFYGCENLNSILIPNSVDSIGGSAFFNCSGLTSITIKANVPPISSASTAILHGAAVCPIYVPAESVEAYKTSPYWSEYADRIQAILEEVVEEPEEVSIVGTWANKTSSELRITFLEDENYVIWNSADSSIEEQTGTYNFDGTTIYLYGTSNSMQGQFVNGELVFDDGVTVYERYVENTYFGIYAHTDDWNWAIKINDDGTWYAAQTAEMLQSGQYESSGTYEINDNKYIHLTGSYEETYEILNETTIVAVEHPENIFYKQSTLA
ncbi:MAG: leucine-rich repeat domain-containing protein, partial [Methanobrevibacter sp.]|nr:leucine-rich repeat domain-containing protein [Methanobrevibacter sp.]